MIPLSELHKRYLFLFHCVSRFFFVYSKTHIFWFDMTNKRIYVWVHPTDETVASSSSLHFPYFDMMHFFRRGYIRKQEMLLNYHRFSKSMLSVIWNLEIWLQVSLSYAILPNWFKSKYDTWCNQTYNICSQINQSNCIYF